MGSARGLGWVHGRHRSVHEQEQNGCWAGSSTNVQGNPGSTPGPLFAGLRTCVLFCSPLRLLAVTEEGSAGLAEPGRATEEPASLPLRPRDRAAGSWPGQGQDSGPSARMSERAALTCPAGSQRAEPRSKLPAPPPPPPTPSASSLRAGNRAIPIGCFLRKPTSAVAPWHLSPPPGPAGAGCSQRPIRVRKSRSHDHGCPPGFRRSPELCFVCILVCVEALSTGS